MPVKSSIKPSAKLQVSVLLKRRLINFYLSLLILALLCLLFLPKTGLGGDLEYWIRWTNWIKEFGLQNIYEMQEVNYFPVYLYMLKLFGDLVTEPVSLRENIYYIKYLILLFDFGAVFLSGTFFYTRKLSPYWGYLLLFNPAFFFNSLFWGQIESLYIFFSIGAIFSALNRKPYLSTVFFVLALFSKLQAIVFLPGLLILIWPQLSQRHLGWLKELLTSFVTFALLTVPFWGSLQKMFTNVLRSVDMFPVISAGALNFWVLLLGGGNMALYDSTSFIIFPYKIWGIALFGITITICLLPVVADYSAKEKLKNEFIALFMLANAIIALAFFYFMTQAHERYMQPAIILLGITFVFKPSRSLLGLYLITSIGFVLNLMKIGRLFSGIDYSLPVFGSRPIALLFGIALVWGVLEIYRGRKIRLDFKKAAGKVRDALFVAV